MKYILLSLLYILPTILFSQTWQFSNIGNSFDGFAKLAYVPIESNNSEPNILGILNYSKEHVLTFGLNGDNTIDKLTIKLKIDVQDIPSEVLMAFDNENNYYLVKFIRKDGMLIIRHAVTTDYNSLLRPIDIVSFFKSKTKVHFRVITKESKQDYTFPLKGSAVAINKVFSCNCPEKGTDFIDYFPEYTEFGLLLGKVNDGQYNIMESTYNCIEYLEKNYAKFYFTQVASVDTKGDEETPTLVFKNEHNEVLAEIEKQHYLKNLYHFSGNYKLDDNNKIAKDTGTISFFYQAFNEFTDLISKNSITLERFSNLSKKELLIYYKSITSNKEFLDYMRQNENAFYYYEPRNTRLKFFVSLGLLVINK